MKIPDKQDNYNLIKAIIREFLCGYLDLYEASYLINKLI